MHRQPGSTNYSTLDDGAHETLQDSEKSTDSEKSIYATTLANCQNDEELVRCYNELAKHLKIELKNPAKHPRPRYRQYLVDLLFAGGRIPNCKRSTGGRIAGCIELGRKEEGRVRLLRASEDGRLRLGCTKSFELGKKVRGILSSES